MQDSMHDYASSAKDRASKLPDQQQKSEMCQLTNSSGKAKVTQLDHTSLGNENILWLHISMDDLVYSERRESQNSLPSLLC